MLCLNPAEEELETAPSQSVYLDCHCCVCGERNFILYQSHSNNTRPPQLLWSSFKSIALEFKISFLSCCHCSSRQIKFSGLNRKQRHFQMRCSPFLLWMQRTKGMTILPNPAETPKAPTPQHSSISQGTGTAAHVLIPPLTTTSPMSHCPPVTSRHTNTLLQKSGSRNAQISTHHTWIMNSFPPMYFPQV